MCERASYYKTLVSSYYHIRALILLFRCLHATTYACVVCVLL
jgi:hypothetical protein